MPWVKIRKAYRGPRGCFDAGTTMQMDDAEASSWIDSKMGEAAAGPGLRPALPQAGGNKRTATDKGAESRKKAVEG